MYCIIKWSGIFANFAYSCETCFPRPYLRVSTPQMLNDCLFGVSVMSQRKRRFTRQLFASTGEFVVHFLMTSQYMHLISRRFLLATNNAMDVSLCLKSVSCKIPDNLIKQLLYSGKFLLGSYFRDFADCIRSRENKNRNNLFQQKFKGRFI